MSAPIKTPEVFELDELDSYSGPVQVKKEPSPKATTSSKPTGGLLLSQSLLRLLRTVLPVAERGRKLTPLPLLRCILTRVMDSLRPTALWLPFSTRALSVWCIYMRNPVDSTKCRRSN
ncbi:hypothetical protein Hanom_Chr02g00100341 [Helianthus anomalus]